MTAPDAITDLLREYGKAMVAGDAELAASYWTPDGVLSAAMLPTVTGPAINDTYAQVFTAFSFDFTFTVDELIIVNDTVAYARTHSDGTQTTLADGVVTRGSNREMFIFRNDDGSWKIARYMYNQAA